MSEPSGFPESLAERGLALGAGWLLDFLVVNLFFSCCLFLCSGRAICCVCGVGWFTVGLCLLCVHGGKKQHPQICFWSALFDSTQDETKSIYCTARPPRQACASLCALLLAWEISFWLEQLGVCEWGDLQETAKLWIVFVVKKGISNSLYQNGS